MGWGEFRPDSTHWGKVFPTVCALVYLEFSGVVFACALFPEVSAVTMRTGGNFCLNHIWGAGDKYTSGV